MEGTMLSIPESRAGWQAVSRRVVDLQRKIRTRNELMAIDEHDYKVNHDADLPLSRVEVRLEVQKVWWQL
jgi:uncharacterized protein YjiS (DUF1127 family)